MISFIGNFYSKNQKFIQRTLNHNRKHKDYESFIWEPEPPPTRISAQELKDKGIVGLWYLKLPTTKAPTHLINEEPESVFETLDSLKQALAHIDEHLYEFYIDRPIPEGITSGFLGIYLKKKLKTTFKTTEWSVTYE